MFSLTKPMPPVPDPDLLRSLWEHVDVIQITKDTSVDTILSAVFRETPKKITEAEISFSDNGMEVSVTAKWIKTSRAGRRWFCPSHLHFSDRRYVPKNL